MNSIIEELWYGNIAPCENCGVGDEEIELLVKLMGEQEAALRRELNEQPKDQFVKYVQWSGRYACLISAKAFKDGFSLAGKILSEIMENP